MLIYVTMVCGSIAAFPVEWLPADIRYSGLWYPIVVAGMTLVVGLFLMPETKDRDIYADD